MSGFSHMITPVVLTTNPRQRWYRHAHLLPGPYNFQIFLKSQVYLKLVLGRTQPRGTQWFIRCSTWP